MNTQKLKMRRRIADGIVAAGMVLFGVQENWDSYFVLKQSGTKHMDRLVSKNCDRRSLHIILSTLDYMRQRDPDFWIPRLKRVESVSKKMRGLAEEIANIEISGFMGGFDREEIGLGAKTGSWPKDMAHPYMFLPKWLNSRAAMYDRWCPLAIEKIPPKTICFNRLGRVCVVLYVKYATGRTYFPEVLQLMHSAGFTFPNAAQISREVKEFECDYPRCCEDLKGWFKMIDPDPSNRKSSNNRRGPKPTESKSKIAN
jgi:hypothetical protein